jgi:23S rRNA pseudouridine1911/1915/1917 synthase
MTTTNNIIVSEQQAGQRLDIFISEQLNISRSQAQKMILNESVVLNKAITQKAAQRLNVQDVITIQKQTNTTAKKIKLSQEQSTEKTPATKIALAKPVVIADTPDYIVINKPTGMLTHPTMAKEKNTLVDFITKKYPKIKKVGDDPIRPGIVHRLDKEASGLIVVAKTQAMFTHLKEQFKNRTIEKEYIALVHGRVARDWSEINFPIVRSENAERMAALPLSQAHTPGAKEAKTEFWIEKKFINFTLLHVKIFTGRMHQIRVHFLAYNHPLVGDPMYVQKKQKQVWDKKIGRLFLHSTLLGFTDLQGEKQVFNSPLPKELAEFLTLLR